MRLHRVTLPGSLAAVFVDFLDRLVRDVTAFETPDVRDETELVVTVERRPVRKRVAA